MHENIYTFINYITNVLTDLTGEKVSFSQVKSIMQSSAN